jgi:hypothetical protein
LAVDKADLGEEAIFAQFKRRLFHASTIGACEFAGCGINLKLRRIGLIEAFVAGQRFARCGVVDALILFGIATFAFAAIRTTARQLAFTLPTHTARLDAFVTSDRLDTSVFATCATIFVYHTTAEVALFAGAVAKVATDLFARTFGISGTTIGSFGDTRSKDSIADLVGATIRIFATTRIFTLPPLTDEGGRTIFVFFADIGGRFADPLAAGLVAVTTVGAALFADAFGIIDTREKPHVPAVTSFGIKGKRQKKEQQKHS